uniref:18S rRNA (guanine(1575)-N(7))-methyltransferase Bud23 C-terminal domain-containing protein n=1 Tax=Fibrocapsa japonica TaxID=94617 RepID=A0A7S2UWN8_9STRA|mmetsp:Transcript_17360/g.25357  ORF Transcript_17360/g.25357 Transcript_17360/m.25357 type:complete len:282 (+) Transcript_17360:63-908(+)
MNLRPELQRPPELFYDAKESKKYNSSSRMIAIQAEIASRAIELLNIPAGERKLILDVGCGSGLSGNALEEAGHAWLGIDISRDMLDVAQERDSVVGDLCQQDMGMGLPFRPASFDGCISISALQWLCYATTAKDNPRHRLQTFFSSLYSVLKRTARAALQFYPADADQAILIAQSATRAGFSGGLVVDYPNSSKAKKYYLCLSFEHSYKVPKGLGVGLTDSGAVRAESRETFRPKSKRRKGARPAVKSRDWIKQKKEKQMRQGKEVRPDSKFTGRKRSRRL